VVPSILATTTEVNPQGSTIEKFLVLNGDLRRRNAETIAGYAKQSVPEILWGGAVFHPFTSTAVEAAFADQRTYFYKGKEVDRQTHLGFHLARVVNSPIVAANRGKVVHAAPLGIYGNCVILDHGMGVQSLYAHLSSIGVQPGQMVEKEQELGKSGMTGLAGGDHLHFTMLVNGQMVNPVEWWDAHWIRTDPAQAARASGADFGAGGWGPRQGVGRRGFPLPLPRPPAPSPCRTCVIPIRL
jgi:murein DD-endopeptidase MepM/ murein hydrolase activator NlpD